LCLRLAGGGELERPRDPPNWIRAQTKKAGDFWNHRPLILVASQSL
jgi:hypothetical protein